MSIYPPSHQPTNALNGIGAMSDGSGTINPAALNSSGTYISIYSSWHLTPGPGALVLFLVAASRLVVEAMHGQLSSSAASRMVFVTDRVRVP